MAKLEVGDVNDPLEREADAVADQVMRMPAPSCDASDAVAPGSDPQLDDDLENEEVSETPTVGAFAGTASLSKNPGFVAHRECASCESEDPDGEIHRAVAPTLVMRACETCEDEDEIRRACSSCDAKEDDSIRRSPMETRRIGGGPIGGLGGHAHTLRFRDAGPRIHNFLRWSDAPTPGSAFAHDRHRAFVEASVRDDRPRYAVREWLLAGRYKTTADQSEIRRACAACDVEGDDEIHREAAAGWRGGPTSGEFAAQLQSRVRLGGRPLPDSARNFLEPRLGVGLGHLRMHDDAPANSLAKQIQVDLGHLRVHDDPAANALASKIHARAFTLGKDIFFARGELRPTSHAGMRLLAHEVAHTLQGSAGSQLARDWQETPDVIRRSCPSLTEKQLADASPGKIRALKLADLLELYVVARSDDEDTCMLAYRALAGYYGVSVTKIDAAMKVAYPNPAEEFPVYQRPTGVKAGHEVGFKITLSNQFKLEDQGLTPKVAVVNLGEGDEKKRAKAKEVATKIDALPPAVKDFLFTEGAGAKFEITLKNYEDLEAVADLALALSDDERAEFLARARAQGGTADNWLRFRTVLEKFVKEQAERNVNLFEMTLVRERLSKMSTSAVDAFIKAKFRWTNKGLSAADEAAEAELAALTDGFANTTEIYLLVQQMTATIEVEAAQVGLAHLAHYQLGLREAEATYGISENIADLHQKVQAAYYDPDKEAQFEEIYAAQHPETRRPSTSRQSAWSSDGGHKKAAAKQNQKRTAKAEYLEAATVNAIAEDHPIVAERGFEFGPLIQRTTPDDVVAKHVLDFLADKHDDVERVRKALQDPAERRAVFEMNELLTMTFESLGLAPSDPPRRLVEEFITEEKFRNSIKDALVAVGEIALGIMAAAIGGPIALGVSLASGIKGIHDTAKAFEEYRLGTAAHSTKLSASAPSRVWVAVTAVAAGVDLLAGAKVVAALKAFDTGSSHSVDDLSRALWAEGVEGSQLDELLDAARARRAVRTNDEIATAAESAKKTPVEINGEKHEVFSWIDLRTGRYAVGLCSDNCGQLARKLELNIAAQPDDAVEARAIMQKYKELAEALDAKVPAELTPDQSVEKAAELLEQLNAELETKGLKGAFNPDITEAKEITFSKPTESDEPAKSDPTDAEAESIPKGKDYNPEREAKAKAAYEQAAKKPKRVIKTSGIEEQLDILMQEIPGLHREQAEYILNQAFTNNSDVIFGGSRIRGDYTDTSDIDIGFSNRTANQAAKICDKAQKKYPDGMRIDSTRIVPGNHPRGHDEPISTPEEFFQRSGIRKGKDNRAGERFYASGSITATTDGKIIILPPGADP